MKIDIWLSKNNKNQSDLARALGINRTRAHRLVKGSKPNDEEAIGIISFTNGEVTPNDFYPLPFIINKSRSTTKTAERKGKQ